MVASTAWLNGLGQKLALVGALQSPTSQGWNFVSGVTAVFNSLTGFWDITVAGGGSGHTIQDEGTSLTARAILNFVGVNVTVADSGGKTVVTIGQVNLATGVTGSLPITNVGPGFIKLDGTTTFTANQSLGGFKLTSGAAATVSTDFVIKSQLDAVAAAGSGKFGFQYTFATSTTDADPGASLVRFDSATLSSVTKLYVDLLDADGNDLTNWLSALDDALGSVKGFVYFHCISDDTKWGFYRLDSITSPGGYVKLNVTYITAGAGGLPSTTAGDTVISFDAWGNGPAAGNGLTGTSTLAVLAADSSLAVSGSGVSRAALTGDVTASAGANATTIANDAVTFAKMLNATAADKVIGSDGAGDFKELSIGGLGLERSGTSIQVSSQLPARGGENVVIDLYPNTQTQGTLVTAASVNFDIAIASGKRYQMTWDIWVDDGAGGACLYTKAVFVKAHQTSGAAVQVDAVVVSAPLESAGFTFTTAANSTNIRGTLGNTSGSTRSYNVIVGDWHCDKP